MATRAQLRARVQNHLNDAGATVWSAALVDAFVEEGLRRCAPVLLKECVTSLTINGLSGDNAVLTLPTDCLHVMRAWSEDWDIKGWSAFAGSLTLHGNPAAVPCVVTLEYLGSWTVPASGDSSVFPLADHQTDVVVYYAVSRALWWLARNRADYKKYASQFTNVSIQDIENLASQWGQEFEAARQEARTHRQLVFERERLAGGPGGEG